MSKTEIMEHELIQQFKRLGADQQQRVLSFARSLGYHKPRGEPATSFLKCAGTFPSEDLEQMQSAIDEHCERIDAEGH